MKQHNLPDSSITVSEMQEYGYAWDGMLPISAVEKAYELYQSNVPIYMLHTNGAESLVDDIADIGAWTGIFGVEKDDWESYLSENKSNDIIFELPDSDEESDEEMEL